MSSEGTLTKEEIHSIRHVLSDAVPIIKQIQELRKSKVFVLFCHQTISQQIAYRISKILRRMENIENLDVILESGGGDINSAYKILKMLKSHVKQTRVIVPFYAKSAASLIAIGADQLVMCTGGELGPIDPQVRDPSSGHFIPAHSIKEAINFIEETKDPLVKLSLADKIPPLLMGAYREAGISAKQYCEEIFDKLGEHKKGAIHTFTERFLSHGYPMDREFLKSIGVNVCNPEPATEHIICNLHEAYTDMCQTLYSKYPDLSGELLVIQTIDKLSIFFGDEDITSKIGDLNQKEETVQDNAVKK